MVHHILISLIIGPRVWIAVSNGVIGYNQSFKQDGLSSNQVIKHSYLSDMRTQYAFVWALNSLREKVVNLQKKSKNIAVLSSHLTTSFWDFGLYQDLISNYCVQVWKESCLIYFTAKSLRGKGQASTLLQRGRLQNIYKCLGSNRSGAHGMYWDAELEMELQCLQVQTSTNKGLPGECEPGRSSQPLRDLWKLKQMEEFDKKVRVLGNRSWSLGKYQQKVYW